MDELVADLSTMKTDLHHNHGTGDTLELLTRVDRERARLQFADQSDPRRGRHETPLFAMS